ncbi:MAG TPA: hypothetical protein VEL28_06370 [Candidatus Binatia bacterium]|nr:hypothetical protein [Candidatus Binatia bacterium]
MRGATLIEMVAAMALAGLAASLIAAGLGQLTQAAALEAGRLTLVDALTEARLLSYEREAPAAVETAIGGMELRIRPDRKRRELPPGVSIADAPADQSIEFRASGLADNATIALRAGSSTAAVVVNQRGVIR